MQSYKMLIMGLVVGCGVSAVWVMSKGPTKAVAKDEVSDSPTQEIVVSQASENQTHSKPVDSPVAVPSKEEPSLADSMLQKIIAQPTDSLPVLNISRSKIQRSLEKQFDLTFEKENIKGWGLLSGKSSDGLIHLFLIGPGQQDDVAMAILVFAFPLEKNALLSSVAERVVKMALLLTPDWDMVEAVQWYGDNLGQLETSKIVAGYLINWKVMPLNKDAAMGMLGIGKMK